MTNEEARRILLDIADQMPSDVCADWIDAIGLGIKALEQQPSDDCISRKAVLDKAINVPIAKIVTDDKVICRKVVFADDIKELPSVTPQPRWIPVSERLPEDEEPVLITEITRNGDLWIDVAYWDGISWDTISVFNTDSFYNIVAWMELPQPYKEDKE